MDELHGLIGLDEELEFHLLEFAGTEGKVLGRHLVAEGLSNLADAKGDLHPGGVADILELGEDGLCRLRAQVGDIILRGGGSDVGAEHQVEWPRLVEQSPGLGMEIDRSFGNLETLFAKQFDFLGLTGGGSRVLGDEDADALAEALDVLSLAHQDRQFAIEGPAS